MATFHIKKGYTIPMQGEPEKKKVVLDSPKTLGICPTDFKGIKPKLTVKEQDKVKVGTPLFFDKMQPEVQFTSPAGGTVSAINFGPRRKVLEIVITVDEDEAFEDFPQYTKETLQAQEGATLRDALLKAGLWPLIRRRPFNTIARLEDSPKALFINCMDTAPIAADPDFALEGKGELFAMGVAAMKQIVGDSVHVVTGKDSKGVFDQAEGVHSHQFSGKHPAGLVGTHIAKIDPINKGECVWVMNARDVVSIGSFFQSGRFPIHRVVALSGTGVSGTGYFEVRAGTQLKDLVGPFLQKGPQRIISGDVLMGTGRKVEGFLGTYHHTVTVLPEPTEKQFLGWFMPGFDRPSFTRTFLSRLIPGKTFKFDTNLNGGHRAMVQSGLYEDVVALDVMPEFLVKAVLCQDIELMEQLGILECDEEDFTLCSYICPSKMEISSIIAEGLELMEKEG